MATRNISMASVIPKDKKDMNKRINTVVKILFYGLIQFFFGKQLQIKWALAGSGEAGNRT
jgi:hypothetical protein